MVVLPRAVAPSTGAAYVAVNRTEPAGVTRVRIGAKTFTEQYILVEVMRVRLAQAGIAVEVVESLGSTVVFDALRLGDLDAYADYSGTIWVNHMQRTAGVPRWQILAEVEAWLARSIACAASLARVRERVRAPIAASRPAAASLGVRAIGDLAPHAGSLALGGDYEWFGRGEWAAVRDTYGLRFARTTTFDPALLYDAVTRGEVDVISAFSSDGRIVASDLVTLADPAGALPPYDAMILLGTRVADDPRVVCALGSLGGTIAVERMRQANFMVDRDADKATPAAAARWLLEAVPVADCRPRSP